MNITKKNKSVINLKAVLAMTAMLLTQGGLAQERGIPIFTDDFGTHMTFAENWVPTRDSKILSQDGRAVFSGTGSMSTRRDTPETFYAEADFAAEPKSADAFAGFKLGSVRFGLAAGGVCVLKEGSVEKGRKPVVGSPVRLAMVRDTTDAAASLVCLANGVEAFRLPAADTAAPLEIVCTDTTLTFDNYALSAIRRAGDSPNLVVNSSFEHAQEGFPLYFSRNGSFTFKQAGDSSYEDYLAAWSLDCEDKHSGRMSLKIVNDERSAGGQAVFAWGVATDAGATGVLSVWLKADRANFPVRISYGGGMGHRTVAVGTEWARYETVNTNLSAPSFYSPVQIQFRNKGTLWLDDLQAEFVPRPTAAELASGRTFATPYRPSTLDAEKFAAKAFERTPSLTVPRLPEGRTPTLALDAWVQHAARLDRFYNSSPKPAKNLTETFFACDASNLYVAVRCHVSDPRQVVTNREMAELNIDPTGKGVKLTQFQFALYANGQKVWTAGYGIDRAWKGNWTGAARINEQESSIDYLFTLPLSDFARPDLAANWLLNVHRYNPGVANVDTLIPSAHSFVHPELWPFAKLPPDVIRPFAIGVAGGGFSKSSVTLDLVNNSESERKVTVELVVDGATHRQDAVLKPGATSVTFEAEAKDPKVGVRIIENGRVICNQLQSLDARDPVAMLGRLSFYMDEPEAAFRIRTSLPGPEKLTAVLECGGKKISRPAAAKFQMALPLVGIPEGTNAVTVSLLDAKGAVVATTATSLVRRPYWEGATQVNHFSRSLVHGGKPVVPVMPFWVFGRAENSTSMLQKLRFWEGSGFHAAHILLDNRFEAATAGFEAFATAAASNDFNIVLWSKYYDEFKTNDVGLCAMIKRLNFPNLLGQQIVDEPELTGSSDSTRDYLRKMRPLFPYQPTFMNNTVLGFSNRHAGLETDILMLDDYLTNMEGRKVDTVLEQADVMWQVGAAGGKPCFYFLVCANMPLHYKEPSYGEQIAQTYGCLVAGCRGFSYFYGFPQTPGNWKAIVQLNKEITSLTDVICSEEEVDEAACDGDAKMLRHRTFLHDGSLYVVSCNIDADPAGKVAFTLPAGQKYADTAEVLFENRVVPIKDGVFNDTFGGHARHVYRVRLK